jgi:hypothetical protein
MKYRVGINLPNEDFFDDVLFVDDKRGVQLVGDLEAMVFHAGIKGDIRYFPEWRCYGLPIRLHNHPHRLHCWWLFEEMEHFFDYTFLPMSKMAMVSNFSNLSSAEFLCYQLGILLEERKVDEPTFMQRDAEDVVNHLTVMMKEMELENCITSIAPLYSSEKDEKGLQVCLIGQQVEMLDGSIMLIDKNGFSVDKLSPAIVGYRGEDKDSFILTELTPDVMYEPNTTRH